MTSPPPSGHVPPDSPPGSLDSYPPAYAETSAPLHDAPPTDAYGGAAVPPPAFPPPYPGYPSATPYAGYGPYGGYPLAQPPRRTNAMALASLISSILFAPLGVVFGHISLSQIKRSGEDGKGFAVAGLVIGYVLTALFVITIVGSLVFTALLVRWASEYPSYASDYPNSPGSTVTPRSESALPPFDPPAALGSNCQYLPSTEPAGKPATPPRSGKVPTTPPIVDGVLVTNVGAIGLQLDNAKAPCTVNNFASLARQGFFDGTSCHRLTTSDELRVLQCGSPDGTANGGPGYQFPNEYPTNQYRLNDRAALQRPVVYPRGTLAMANAGPGTNGSQFFMVYEDSLMPPTYTVFGTVDPAGLTTLDEVAADGVQNGGDDGEPVRTVTIESARVN